MPKASELTDDQRAYIEACVHCVKLLEQGIPRRFPKGRSTIRVASTWTDIAAYGTVKLRARCIVAAGRERTHVDVNWMDWRPKVFLLDLTREGPGTGVWEGMEWCLQVVKAKDEEGQGQDKGEHGGSCARAS